MDHLYPQDCLFRFWVLLLDVFNPLCIFFFFLSDCSGHLSWLHVVSDCLLSTTGIHPQQEHHAGLCWASNAASSRTFNQKGHSPHPVVHEKEAVSPCCVSWQLDGKQSRVACYPLRTDKFCIFRQVKQALGTWRHVMILARSGISLSVFIINAAHHFPQNFIWDPKWMSQKREITAI